MKVFLDRFNKLNPPMKVLAVPGLLFVAFCLLCISPLILFVLAIGAASEVLRGNEDDY